MTQAEKTQAKLDNNKRGSNVLQFPLDLDTEGTRNVFLININTISGSQYNSNNNQKRTEDPKNTVQGEKSPSSAQQQGAVYQRKDSNSIARLMSGSYVRTDTSIALYMPSTVQTSYDSNWGATDLGMGAGTATNLYDMWKNDSGKSFIDKVTQSASAGLNIASQAAAAGASGVGVFSAKELYAMNQQVATNPYTEVLFNGVNNRTFSFTFKMMPRDAAEQAAIKKIVDTIKFHRAPEKDQNSMNVFWKWPSTFDLSFRKKNGEENEWLFKISTCALTQFSVEYGGDGFYGSYEDGSPLHTTMTLGFTELEILDKSSMQSGF